jgi:hypothetical protein
MSKERIIPVAYVTRWAATEGIRIVRGAEVTDRGALFARDLYVNAKDWTEDKTEAEARHRAKIEAARKAAARMLKALEVLAMAAPKYAEGD